MSGHRTYPSVALSGLPVFLGLEDVSRGNIYEALGINQKFQLYVPLNIRHKILVNPELFNTLYALVEASGLDPFAGFFHQSSYGHPALVSDLMEPYRAPIVDRLIVHAINKREITPEHFIREEKEWKLTTAGLEKFVGFYQDRLKQRITVNQQSQSIWHILQNDIWQFQKYIEGESQNFSPFIFR